jgi:hypothetical protein
VGSWSILTAAVAAEINRLVRRAAALLKLRDALMALTLKVACAQHLPV